MFLSVFCLSQNSFEIIWGTEKAEGFYNAFEVEDNNYIILGSQNSNYGADSSKPLMVKFDSYGRFIKSKVFDKTDTTGILHYGFQKPDGNFLIIGTLSDPLTPKDHNITWICTIDQDFNLVWEKFYLIPEPYHSHSIENYLLTGDNKIIMQGRADSSLYAWNNSLFLCMTNMQGNMLEFEMYENWKDLGHGELLYKPDSSGFFLIGNMVEYSFPRDWIEYDNDLNLINSGVMENSLGFFYNPITIARLENGNLFCANRSSGIQIPSTQDLEIRIMDSDFSLLKDTVLFFEEYVSLPDHKGMDFTDENNIWVGAFVRTPPSFPGVENIWVHIFEADGNLKGVKEYGGDNRFWLYHLMATSDGGCLVTGKVPDYNGADNNNGYLLKVMPEDIITDIQAPNTKNNIAPSVYPNPFNSEITVEVDEKGASFTLYNSMSNRVISEQFCSANKETINTIQLYSGIYFFTIQINDRIIETGKLVKF